ncbi:hypothetical protein Tco_0468204 [Tanacetum coccineum]
MGLIIQCLGGKIGGLDQISNKDATILYYLANDVQVDYAKIIWEDLIHKLNKKTREKIVPYPRFISLLLEHMAPKYDKEELTINPIQVFSVHNWILKPKQPEEPPITDHIKAICNLDVPVDSKAPKYSSPTEEVPQGKKPGARSRLRRKQSSKHTSESATKASKSQSSYSKKETKSSSVMETSPSHPSPPTPVGIDEGTKNYSFAHILVGSNPSVLVKKTKSARDGLKTAHTTSDEPITVSDESEEEEDAETDKDTEDTLEELKQAKVKAEAEVASMKSNPSYLNINQLTELLVTSLKLKLSKLLASYDFASYLPIELKELSSKITKLSGEIKELKQHVKDMEIELPGDLVEIPTKVETFTISSLSSQIAKLENIQ